MIRREDGFDAVRKGVVESGDGAHVFCFPVDSVGEWEDWVECC